MKRFNYLLFIVAALASYCYSEEVEADQRWKQDIDKTLQRILQILAVQDEVLAVQDEKINLIHANQFLPTCTEAIRKLNFEVSRNCWKEFMIQLKTVDYTIAKEMQILGLLIKSYCRDDNYIDFPKLATFIEKNVENGSELAVASYNTLLAAMADRGYLYINKTFIQKHDTLDITYKTLIQIRNAEGDVSPIFTQTLPSAVNTILSEKEMYIRNNETGDYLYAATSGLDDPKTNILVDSVKANNPRYIWKLKQLQAYNYELPVAFYVVNSFDNKILIMTDNDGSMKLEQDGVPWSVFNIRLVQGSSGEAVAIQNPISMTLGLDENEEGKVPKMCESSFADTPTGVWLLQPKE